MNSPKENKTSDLLAQADSPKGCFFRILTALWKKLEYGVYNN